MRYINIFKLHNHEFLASDLGYNASTITKAKAVSDAWYVTQENNNPKYLRTIIEDEHGCEHVDLSREIEIYGCARGLEDQLPEDGARCGCLEHRFDREDKVWVRT